MTCRESVISWILDKSEHQQAYKYAKEILFKVWLMINLERIHFELTRNSRGFPYLSYYYELNILLYFGKYILEIYFGKLMAIKMDNL